MTENFYKLLFISFLFLLVLSCDQNKSSLPEDNNTSYLELNTTRNSEKTVQDNPNDASDVIRTNISDCTHIQVGLIGNIIQKSIMEGTKGTEVKILRLASPYQLNCNNHEVKVRELKLNLQAGIDPDAYVGSTVLVVGEINPSQITNLPLALDAIRVEATKESMN